MNIHTSFSATQTLHSTLIHFYLSFFQKWRKLICTSFVFGAGMHPSHIIQNYQFTLACLVYYSTAKDFCLSVLLQLPPASNCNVFEFIHMDNQAVSVVVTACHGVDATPKKLACKYTEIYMALDIILRGITNIRLTAMLATMHGNSIAKMAHSAIDTENKVRGADSWSALKVHSLEHRPAVDAFSTSRIELLPETLLATDEVATALAPAAKQQDEPNQKQQEEPEASKDPFAANDAINKPQELVGGFKTSHGDGKESFSVPHLFISIPLSREEERRE